MPVFYSTLSRLRSSVLFGGDSFLLRWLLPSHLSQRILGYHSANTLKVVPSNDPNLLHSTGNAAESPFVIAAKRAGIKVVPSIINFIVLTSAWSAGNSVLLGSSRTLYGMAREGHAPKLFLRTSRMGIPYVAVGFISMFMTLGYMTLSSGASVVFGWLQDLVSVAALIGWMVICTVYLRFYYGCKVQGIDRSELPWKAPFQPYAAWFSLVSFALLLLTGGYTVFIEGK